jgi:WD40 repeat protein
MVGGAFRRKHLAPGDRNRRNFRHINGDRFRHVKVLLKSSELTTITMISFSQKFVAKLDSEILGAGVLDIKWESPATLWSCGYDSHLRRWDLRTGKCEQALGDPCGAAVYCFQYDHFNSIISGTQTNGRVVLWDTRQDNYVQVNIGSRPVVTLM